MEILSRNEELGDAFVVLLNGGGNSLGVWDSRSHFLEN